MKKVVIVGAGPAGMFASYLLGNAGLDVTLIEMGEDIKERSEKIKDGGSTAAVTGLIAAREIIKRENLKFSM